MLVELQREHTGQQLLRLSLETGISIGQLRLSLALQPDLDVDVASHQLDLTISRAFQNGRVEDEAG